MRRGFTLIELLVIISIIGIFSAVALAMLGGARDKGRDATIKGNLNTVRTQAELYFNTTGNGTYSTGLGYDSATCDNYLGISGTVFNHATVENAIRSAYVASGSDWNNTRCSNDWAGTTYAIAVRSRADTTKWHCSDSKGANKVLTATPSLGGGAAGAACP